MWVLLLLLSFFVGGLLLLLVGLSLFDAKRNHLSNFFFFAILLIAGVQRVAFGLDEFGELGSFSNPFTQSLLFAYFIPPIYFFFFRSLLLVHTPRKVVLLHFGLALFLVLLALGLEWGKGSHQAVFLVFSTAYFGNLIYSVTRYLRQRKTQRDLQHFKTVRVWAYLMLGAFAIIYFFANFFYGQGLESTQKEVLGQYYGVTSPLWLFIAFYLLKNPRILFGELRLMEHMTPVLLEEISIWRVKKKGPTNEADQGVEKQVEGRVEALIFSLKKMEQGWAEELLEVPSLKTLAFRLDCPQSHLKYLFKYYGNFTYGEYVNVLKVNFAISLIRKGFLLKHTIDTLSKKALFQSGNTFYLNFKKLTGESPSDFHAHLLEEKGRTGGSSSAAREA